jgi:hypothetical protein
MPTLDANAAKAAGYSDAEIQMFMAQQVQGNQGMSHAAGLTQQYVPGPNDPTADMSPGQILAAGAGRGLTHTARSVGNLVGLVPDSSMATEKQIDAPLLARRGGETGNIIGEAAATAPFTMGASAGMGQLGRLGATIARNPITNMALQGGVQGLATADPGQRGLNTTVGALTGAGLATGGSLVSKLARGLNTTPEARLLLNQGISLTPGQLNPGGAANQFESAAESIPGVKQIVHGARENAEQQYQARIVQAGAAPGVQIKPSENIHDMLQQAYDSYAPLYDKAKGFPVQPAIVNTGANTPLSTAFDQAARTPGTTKTAQSAAKSWLDNELSRLPPNPDSADLLKVRSNIRTAARNAKLSTDTVAQDKAAIFSAADQHVTKALESQLPSDALDALRTADSQYGQYKIVENAVAKSKDNLAGLTPQKLSQSIYDSTADPSYARGAGGPLRDLAKAGTSVFQTVVPPTGARVATLGAGLLGAMHAPGVAIPVGTGMLGLTGTQTGRRMAAGMTAPQQAAQRLAAALGGAIPPWLQAPGQQLLQRGAVGATMPYTPTALGGAAALASGLMPTKPQ